MLRLACALAIACTVLAACGPGRPEPDPDLSTARGVTWTNTAKELSGGRAKATIYGFGDSGNGGPTSAASGELVLTQTWTDRVATVVAQSAKTGRITWRRDLSIGRGGWSDCEDDQRGPVFVCKVGTAKSAALWVMADRTGAVRKKLPVSQDIAFGISGEDVYLASFRPNHKGSKLTVRLERRSWSTGRSAWRQKTSFAIEGWGHDGGSGFEFGRDRVVAYSASWQVVVDRQTGRLLERSDNGRWESELSNGGRIVLDSGDGTSDRVQVTLFSPDGRPISESRDGSYPLPFEVGPDRIVIGRRLLSMSTGRAIFVGPKRSEIVAVANAGRRAVVAPAEFALGKNRVPLAIYDSSTGKKTGVVVLKGNASDITLAGGNGVVTVVGHYDDKSDTELPPTIDVIDVRKPDRVASVPLRRNPHDYANPTLLRTSAGFAVTDEDAVRGFVAR